MISIRRASDNDKELCANILFNTGLAKSEQEAKEAVEKEFKRGDNFILAEENNKPLGLVTWILQGSPRHQLVELYHIGVVQEGRKKGIASLLFQQLEHDANKYLSSKGFALRKLYLLTHIDNIAAINFYQKMGMHQEAVLRSHFGEKDEAVMAKIYPPEASFPNHISTTE